MDWASDSAAAVWAVIPAKQLDRAKQRLRACLSGSENLPLVLFRRTLAVVRASHAFCGAVIVSSDPEIAEAARTAGAIVISDPGEGLNPACAAGLAAAANAGARICALIHSDLPRLSPWALSALVDEHRAACARAGTDFTSLVRCKDGSGTNLVLCNAAGDYRPMFGPGSFARHWQAGGEGARELVSPEASFDLDTPADLATLTTALELPSNASTEAVIARLTAECEEIEQGTASTLAELPASALQPQAAVLRDTGHGALVTYSRKVFLPLTQLCRDVCHYCTFAKAPRHLASPFMALDEVLAVAEKGAALGCKEALFTLGERPELRYNAARDWLDQNGFASTLEYVAHAARSVRERTGLLPHINAGCMSAEEMAMLRPVSGSMGLMLESGSARLCGKGGPHYGSPDKHPALRLATIEEAGRQSIPFTTGLLVGIGETRKERLESLLQIRRLHARHGHVQELIIQNFVPKPDTKMADAPAADVEELCWTISAARLLFGPEMSIQAPPNLSPDTLPRLIEAGINDWGGVSPLTADFVNPEAPWPEIERLRGQTQAAGKTLAERLTIYPVYAADAERWLDPAMRQPVRELSDAENLGRENGWLAGRSADLPPAFALLHRDLPGRSRIAEQVQEILGHGSGYLTEAEIAGLFEARGADFHRVCEAADMVREAVNGDVATYVVNRNINYTNICNYRCAFCAFSKGTRKHEGAEKPYLLDLEEIGRRVTEAREKGGTEVCLQGGIHPTFTGETYIDILRAVKRADPAMHIHAFSPLEVWHGATTLGMHLDNYLDLLRREGLGSLPGTAAEILHDPVRQVICPDKLNTDQWLEVIEAAHGVGLRTTATIMFGHVDGYRDWAIHLLRLRALQKRTGGFTEFVPLPFVAHEAPLYKRGQARPGPTLREAVLMHAVARLVLFPLFENIQASWVKMGREGMREALRSGANDLGGTLMNESITRAAGATHGQEFTTEEMQAMAASLGRTPARRTTTYKRADETPQPEKLP